MVLAWAVLSANGPTPPPPLRTGTGAKGEGWTSCAIKEARSGNFTPPGTIWVQGGAGLGWVWSRGANLAPGPLGSVAGDPDRHRGWLLCPSPVPAAAGRGLRPRVFSAHGPPPQLQVQDLVMGRRPMPHCWHCVYPVGTNSRKKDHPNCRTQRPKLDRYVQYECCEGTARSEMYGNWPLGGPRAAAPGKYGLKSGENGHLSRANGATGGSYCSPALPSVCGRQFEPLAGQGGGFGTRSCTSAAAVTRGALLQIECLRKTQGTQAVRRGVGRLCAGCLGY
jgi:hypothetical protein